MMSNSTKRWIDAVKAFAADRAAKVPCPECGKGPLQVREIDAFSGHKEDVMSCPDCGARNYALKKI